jgi:thiamine pyrophosphokinase
MTKGTYSHSNRHRMHEKDTESQISDEASTFIVTCTKEEIDKAFSWLEKSNEQRDTNYDDRLEMEVSSLKRDNTRLQTKVTQLEYDLKRAHIQIHDLRLSNEQLRQAIAVLNDEPTNSL